MPGDSSADGDPSSLPPLPAALSTAPADEEGRAGGSPPAPDLPPPARAAGGGIAAGGHLLRFEPAGGGPTQVGVLRVERTEDGRLRASGDLYDDPGGVPADNLPVLPRDRYRGYLRLTGVGDAAGGFEPTLELHRLEDATGAWTPAGALRGVLARSADGDPDLLAGTVRDGAGRDAGRLEASRVSPWLRRAVVEIDRVPGAPAPRHAGAGRDWAGVYGAVGWDLRVEESDEAVEDTADGTWSDAEVHAAMLRWRDGVDLDREWHYHVLCVRHLDSTTRGIMYDAFGGDSNQVPREGMALAADWAFPDEERWGRVRGRRFADEPESYLRTVVHELGHAMGLAHAVAGTTFMRPTGSIAGEAAPGTFPDNSEWAFTAGDALRLRHLPDPCVRPGGLPFAEPGTDEAPLEGQDSGPGAGFELDLRPLAEGFPLGAPVRVEVGLANRGGGPLAAPLRLGLKGGHVRGRVVDPDGRERWFWPLVRCIDSEQLAPIAPGAERRRPLALLRGPHGALFPTAGRYRVWVEAVWPLAGRLVDRAAECAVTVTPAADAAHAAAAREVLGSPELLLTLALAGDHLEAGRRALAAALADPRLRPHYAAIAARCALGRHHEGEGARAEARRLLRGGLVAGHHELAKLRRRLRRMRA